MSRIFFTDRDLGKKFPEILRAAGLTVEQHADHFAHNCSDETWLAAVGQREWIAITHNSRIRYMPNELAAVMEHRVALLVVVGHAPYPQLANSFVATRDRILAFLDRHEPPFIAKVYRASATDVSSSSSAPGTIALWHPVEIAKPHR